MYGIKVQSQPKFAVDVINPNPIQITPSFTVNHQCHQQSAILIMLPQRKLKSGASVWLESC